MDEHKPSVLTPTEVFKDAHDIGNQELRRVNGELAALSVAGTVVNFVDRLTGKPGSYTATDLRERLWDLKRQKDQTTVALLTLGALQEMYDPRGIRVAKVTNELIGATRLAMATGVIAPVELLTRELDMANMLPSSLPVISHKEVCIVNGNRVHIDVTDPNPGPNTLYRYAKYMEQ